MNHAPKVTSFQMALKNCSTHGQLPSEGDFLQIFEWTNDDCGTLKNIPAIQAIVVFTGPSFYVRKAIQADVDEKRK